MASNCVDTLALHCISKRYGARTVLDNVSLTFNTEEIVGIVGPNGAGKSTLLGVLAGGTKPASGDVLLNGNPALPAVLRREIGFLSHVPAVYPELTVFENMQMFAGIAGVNSAKQIDTLKTDFELEAFYDDTPARELSRGQLQRLALACCTLGAPSILLLDEPTTGLDLMSQDRIVQLIRRQQRAGGICIVASHQPEFIQDVCTHVVALRYKEVLWAKMSDVSREGLARMCRGEEV